VLRFILSRFGNGLLILWGVVTLLFFIFHALPSDPARMMLGQRSDISSEDAIRKELGLDQPLMVQYAVYLNDLSPIGFLKNDSSSVFFRRADYGSMVKILPLSSASAIYLKAPWLRRSYQTQMPVANMLRIAFPATALLALVSILLAFVLGVFLGAVSARWKGKWPDKLLMITSVLGMSVPSFFASVLIAWLFAYILGDFTGLNMFGSLYEVDDLGRGEYIAWKNLILPAFTLSIRPLAVFISLSRNSVLEVQQTDYVRTAKSKGLPNRLVFMRHVLKNSLNPVITAASGWFASLLAGAVFVEYVFDWKGIGYLVVQSLEKYDLPVLMGCLLIIAVMFIIINIVLDLSYRLLDPRVKL
jgi:peptide/nickel transport system permease protein